MGLSIYDDITIKIYFCFLAGLFGAVMGSFLHCVAYRIVSGESFTKGRSHCPKCGHVLGVMDLFPVFSWIFLRGKCRYCKEKIPARYLLSEIFMALMSILCLLRYDLSPLYLGYFAFLCCLFTLSLVDLDQYIIPDLCLILAVIIFIVMLPFQQYSLREIVLHVLAGVLYSGGLLVISLIFDHILNKESLGGGDIKLFAVVGLYLGVIATLFTLLLSCIFGLFMAYFQWKKAPDKNSQIPFGPAIALATWIMVLYGTNFVNWYLHFLGI